MSRKLIVTISDEYAERIERMLEAQKPLRMGNWIDFRMEGESTGTWMGKPDEWKVTYFMGCPARLDLEPL